MNTDDPAYRSWALEALVLKGKRARNQRRAATTTGSLTVLVCAASIIAYQLAKRTDARFTNQAAFNALATQRIQTYGVRLYDVKRGDSYAKLYGCERNNSAESVPPPSFQAVEAYKKVIVNLQDMLADTAASPLKPPIYTLHQGMKLALPDLNGDTFVGCMQRK